MSFARWVGPRRSSAPLVAEEDEAARGLWAALVDAVTDDGGLAFIARLDVIAHA
jgi:hypothetical protein